MSYPYANKITSLKSFLEKIPNIQVPDKLDYKTLSSLGFKSSNDRPIVAILKFVGFLNSDATPTENYINFRSKEKAGPVMAKCLKSAYSELFGLYGDAQKRTNEELKNFFSTRTKGGDLVQSLTVSTFKTLCEFADFEVEYTPKGDVKDKGKSKEAEGKPQMPQVPQGLAINMNIQITLPVTEDAKVYENIFKALREQLFKQE